MVGLTRFCAISVLTLMLGGCPSQTGKVVSDYCDIYDPIRASRLDTSETLKQVRKQNLTYVDLCKAQMQRSAEEIMKR